MSNKKWGTARDVKDVFSLGQSQLIRLIDDGVIRTKKLGPDVRSGRLYNLKDIEDFLNGDADVE